MIDSNCIRISNILALMFGVLVAKTLLVDAFSTFTMAITKSMIRSIEREWNQLNKISFAKIFF